MYFEVNAFVVFKKIVAKPYPKPLCHSIIGKSMKLLYTTFYCHDVMCNPEFNFALYYLHSDVFYPFFLDLTSKWNDYTANMAEAQ